MRQVLGPLARYYKLPMHCIASLACSIYYYMTIIIVLLYCIDFLYFLYNTYFNGSFGHTYY